jgi:hypothetical protein
MTKRLSLSIVRAGEVETGFLVISQRQKRGDACVGDWKRQAREGNPAILTPPTLQVTDDPEAGR